MSKLELARKDWERAYLAEQLKRSGGSVARAAKEVGVERTSLYHRLRRLGMKIEKVAA